MKKLFTLMLFAVLLTGCGADPVYETIGDIPIPQESPQMLEMLVTIPEEAAAMVMTGEDGAKLYMCEDYYIVSQILPAGDMESVFLELTGYSWENLQVIQTKFQGLDRYRAAWSTAAEDADQIGQACIYSDGNYCYALVVMAPEDKAGALAKGAWKDMFDSFRVVEAGSVTDSGS